MNATAERMFGYSRDALRNASLEKLIPEPRSPGASFKLTGISKDGREFPVEMSLSYVRSQEGTISVAFISDITQRKRAEQEVARLNQELEQRVRDRTAQLEAANREMEAFSYSVSHDLRAPLRSVDGYSQVVLRDYGYLLDEEGRRLPGKIRAGAKRMAQLIEDLLNLSRIARSRINVENVNLSEVAREVVEDLRTADRERSTEVRIEKGLEGRGDRRLISVVLNNLIENAWKFTAKEERAVIEFSQLIRR